MDKSEHIFAAVVDLETTGLEAQKDVPLEVGIKLIDKEGFVFGEHSWLVWERTDDFKAGVRRGVSNDFVNNMHTENGLWNELSEVDRGIGPHPAFMHMRQSVDEQMVDFLADHIGEEHFGTVPMMGNSIGSLDRPFCLQHFPLFNEALSYRNIDISTLKEICKAVNPGLFENLRPIIGTKADATHRVLDDIDACITEYRAYLENFLFVEL